MGWSITGQTRNWKTASSTLLTITYKNDTGAKARISKVVVSGIASGIGTVSSGDTFTGSSNAYARLVYNDKVYAYTEVTKRCTTHTSTYFYGSSGGTTFNLSTFLDVNSGSSASFSLQICTSSGGYTYGSTSGPILATLDSVSVSSSTVRTGKPAAPTSMTLSNPIYCGTAYTFDRGSANQPAQFCYWYTDGTLSHDGWSGSYTSYTGAGHGNDTYQVGWRTRNYDASYPTSYSDWYTVIRTVTLNSPSVSFKDPVMYGTALSNAITTSPASKTPSSGVTYEYEYAYATTSGGSYTAGGTSANHPYLRVRVRANHSKFNSSGWSSYAYRRVTLNAPTSMKMNSTVYYGQTYNEVTTLGNNSNNPSNVTSDWQWTYSDTSASSGWASYPSWGSSSDQDNSYNEIKHPFVKVRARHQLSPYLPSSPTESTVKQVTLNAPDAVSHSPSTVYYGQTVILTPKAPSNPSSATPCYRWSTDGGDNFSTLSSNTSPSVTSANCTYAIRYDDRNGKYASSYYCWYSSNGTVLGTINLVPVKLNTPSLSLSKTRSYVNELIKATANPGTSPEELTYLMEYYPWDSKKWTTGKSNTTGRWDLTPGLRID